LSEVAGTTEGLEEDTFAVVAKSDFDGACSFTSQLNVRIPPKRQYYAERREAARVQSWLDVEAALAELTINPRRNAGFEHPRNANWPMFSPIVNFRFGATAGYTGSRGTGEARPRGKPCCHRLQSAVSSHFRYPDRTDRFDPHRTDETQGNG
jgi:hypothetical protein